MKAHDYLANIYTFGFIILNDSRYFNEPKLLLIFSETLERPTW